MARGIRSSPASGGSVRPRLPTLAEVPVIVRQATDEEMLELALVENLQRSDLDPIEKAVSFKSYLDSTGKTQEVAAARLGP